MIQTNRAKYSWLIALMLLGIAALAACSGGGDQMLLAEQNRDFEVEIFLANVGDEESDWQSLAEDVTAGDLFPGRFATFVPDSDHIVIWYEDGDDLRVEQMKVGDESPNEIFEADTNEFVFGQIASDPFAVYFTESSGFAEFKCYVSLEGAEAERVGRGRFCAASETGVIVQELDDDDTTLTLISLDGEDETVILDDVRDVDDLAWNEELSTFAYVELGRRDAQVYLIEPGDEEGVALGDEFALINSLGFFPDGETVFVIGKLDEDDDELGLFINGGGDPLLEDDSMRFLHQSEDGENVAFSTSNSREEAVFIYNVDAETMVEVAAGDDVGHPQFVGDDRFVMSVQDNDDGVIFSANADGSEGIELFSEDEFTIQTIYADSANGRLYALVSDEDGTDSLFVSSLDEADGTYLLEEWAVIMLLEANDEAAIFAGREDLDDDWVLYSISLEDGASEVELDDDSEDGFGPLFFSKDGRSVLYTAQNDGFDDLEVRQVPIDGSEQPEMIVKDVLLLDVSWADASNLDIPRR